MSSELLGKFMAKFDAADEQKKGSLDKTQFAAVLKQLMDASDKTVELYFHGLDVCNNNTVSRDEFESFVKACLTRDDKFVVCEIAKHPPFHLTFSILEYWSDGRTQFDRMSQN